MDNVFSSIQESAANFANTILASINAAVAETVGVDVLWFRLMPDQKSKDVIFQTYTLYGVQDCPLEFKAVYTDNSYDDAAITYQIMGLNYAVPLTLEVPVETWKTVTGDDGTIPQKGDIVFIPMSRKLLQVVSMTPVKAVGAQLTSYKMNMETYKPSRSVLVGDNLRTAIETNTTNLEERFGKDIDEELKDIVDNPQLSIFNSTEKDEHKEVAPVMDGDRGIFDIKTIIRENLNVDGHLVSRGHYDLDIENDYVVKYKNTDTFDEDSERCYSCWVKLGDFDTSKSIKNIKDPELTTLSRRSGQYYIKFGATLGKKFNTGDSVIFSRGQIIVPGYVSDSDEILLNHDIVKKLNSGSDSWFKMPGFAVTKDNRVNLLYGEDADGNILSIDICGNTFLTINMNGTEKAVRILQPLVSHNWYGIIVNMAEKVSVDVYKGTPSLERISTLSDIKWNGFADVDGMKYLIKPSCAYLTNIRLYTQLNTDVDKQIKDLISYNVVNDSRCVINDSADVYLNKPFVGIQR